MFRKFLITIFFFLTSFLIPTLTHAADLYIVLDKTQTTERGQFSGTVYVSSDGTAINNAEATIHFPIDLITVESVSTTNSIFNIFVQQPTFSNTAGTIYFNGGLPTPGFTGVSGQIAKITFTAKKIGTAALTFGSSAVRANDGRGTDVLTQARGASITIGPLVPTQQDPNLAQIGLPKAPIITSEDMPDADSWYNLTSAKFSWSLPAGVTAAQLILSRSPSTEPSVLYTPAVSSKTLTNLIDGTLYLNARFKNSIGWSKIASRKIQVDTIAPEQVTAESSVTSDDLISVIADAKDTVSGLERFEVYEGTRKIAESAANEEFESTAITLPTLSANQHTLTVRAYDKADNFTATELIVESPKLKSPTITNFPDSVKVGSRIEILGTAPYSNAQVNLWIKIGGASEHILLQPNADRVFSYTSPELKKSGVVNIWAETVRDGIVSEPSQNIFIQVNETGLKIFGFKTAQTLTTVISIVVLIIVLIGLIYFGIRKIRDWKYSLSRDLNRNEKEIHDTFRKIRENNARHLRILDKAHISRTLNREERRIFNELAQNLDDIEFYLEDKMRKVEEMERERRKK